MLKFRQQCKVVFAALRSRSISTFYDNISSIYDDVFNSHEVHAHNIAQVLTAPLASRKHKASVLDLGCGTGMSSTILATAGFNIIGMDISFFSLCRIKLKMNTPKVLQADANFLPIHSCSLDAVVSLGSWRHFTDIERVTLEISRVLKSQGIFIVGYFPPALAGIIPISHNWCSQLLCWLYGAIIRKLGYWDRVDCLFADETEKILKRQFKDVHNVVSGSGKHLLYARYPKSLKGEVVSVA